MIEPDSGVIAIGSGGSFAQAAATALFRHTEMSAREIAESALRIAGEICIYTNDRIAVDSLGEPTVATSSEPPLVPNAPDGV